MSQRALVPAATLGLLLALAAPAAAQGKAGGKDAKAADDAASKVCIESYEQVQTLRDQGQLLDAREKAIACASDTCPKVLASECAQWLDQIAQSLPSVVVGATAPDGQDLVAVKVSVDGRPLAEELGARALPVDPGAHTFRFESAEHGTVDLKVVIREGEKNRRIVATFEKKPDPNAPKGPVAPTMTRPIPVSVWVLGGVGAAGIVGGTIFEVLGLVKKGELEDCKPACPADDVDAMTRNFVIGDVAIAVGAVSLAAGALVFFTRPEVAEPTAAAWSPELLVGPLPGGGFAGVAGRF